MSELSSAIRAICDEKGLSYEAVVATIEQALAAAYRKDYGQKNQNIKVEFDPETGKSKIFDVKTVVEDMPEEELDEAEGGEGDPRRSPTPLTDRRGRQIGGAGKNIKTLKPDKQIKEKEGKKVGDKKIEEEDLSAEAEAEPSSAKATEGEEEERKFNPRTDIQISDAKLLKKTAKVGQEIRTKLEAPSDYGRMAAQTAKQVIIQRLREAEREMIFSEFKDKQGEVISGVVQRREGRFVLVDIGKTVGCLPNEEQIFNEKYNPGERIKVYIKEVRAGSKGAEVVLSRTSDEILKKIFYLEIPEISNGLVELKGVAREAGSRSKVAVWTDSDNVDPIGSCVGQRGARIQTIISELGGEKVDIVVWNEEPAKFIANALSPAKTLGIEIDSQQRKATVKVAENQLSLAIGKNGQNARLAARLTGWRIDIVGDKGDSQKNTETLKHENKEEAPEGEKKIEAEKENEKKEKESKMDKKPEEDVKEKKKSDASAALSAGKKEDKKKSKDDKKKKTDKKDKEIKKDLDKKKEKGEKDE